MEEWFPLLGTAINPSAGMIRIRFSGLRLEASLSQSHWHPVESENKLKVSWMR